MKFAYLFITFILITSCKSNVKTSQYSLVDKGINGSFHRIDIIDTLTKNKISLYFDKESNLAQINNHDEKYFKVTFGKNEGVKYVENKRSNTEIEKIWLEESNGNGLVIKKIHFPFKTVLTIQNKFHPEIESYNAINSKGSWFLSEYKYFDFCEMKIVLNDNSEFIQLLSRPTKEEIGKEGFYKFKIVSNFKDNRYLLKGNFKRDFTSVGKIDTIYVSDIFNFKYTPSSKEDTIRFIIYHNGKVNGERMGKYIYYELPIRLN